MTDWLPSHLGTRDPRTLMRHPDPRLRHLGLERLGARPDSSLAALLPRTLDGPPETALLLAGLYQRHAPSHDWPRWRDADLPVRVRIAWLRAEILVSPHVVRTESPGEELYQAVSGLSAADAQRPEELVRELAGSGDPVLRDAAVRLAREGLHGALLGPARARELIGSMLDGPFPGAALRELAEPWAALGPLPAERLRPLLASPNSAVIAAAARHGHAELLREVAADPSAPPRSRQRALEAWGDLAGHDDLGAITALAATDPLLLGGPAVACLRAMHRRGVFVSGDDAAAVVALALGDHTIDAASVATMLFTCRHAAFRALTDAEAGDPLWPRRLALLVALARQGGDDLPIGEAVAGMLPGAAVPEPFLTAIGQLRHSPAEAAVLDALPRAPSAALGALEVIGGPLTVAYLTEGLGLTSESGVIAGHLRGVRHRALELLWHLTEDADRRRAILERLDPRDLPRRIATDLGAPDRRELELLSAGFDPDDPGEALLRLARNGDAATIPAIGDLLLRVVSDLVEKRETTVPGDVVEAVSGLGRRLHDRGTLRPYCLREATDAKAAGRALVATVALDLLDRDGLTGDEQAVLLELLLQTPYGGTRARVHRLLRHRDGQVRKHVVALLAGDDAQALSASLIALTTAGDAPTVRQALLALGSAGARWAAPAIAACLDHPTMNVKKTAASVLVHAGTPAAVPRLLLWLGRHDNPGLRGTLVEALRAILGTAYAATVLAAAEQADDDRTRDLLLTALGRLPSARAAEALARQGSPVAPALLGLVADGRVGLGSGTVEDLAGQFAAHGIAVPAQRPPATDDDIDALLLDGWDAETARTIVNRHERGPDGHEPGRGHVHERGPGRPGGPAPDLSRLRPMLADWLRLAAAEPATRAATLRFVLRICPPPWSDDEIETFARAAETLVSGLPDDRDGLLEVLEAVAPALHSGQALDLAARIRALPPAAAGRRSTLAVLRACGAVLTRTDIDHALAAARLGPDPWLAEPAILRDAFTAGEDASAPGEDVSTPGGDAFTSGGAENAVPSRERLRALIDEFPSAGRETRSLLLDRMEALQPIDAPPWTLAERAAPPEHERMPRDGDLDQPRSEAQRVRLLGLLDVPTASRRDAAALALREWPEPETRRALLETYLRGRADVPVTKELASALTDFDETELRGYDGERVALTAYHLESTALYPLLLQWWQHGEPRARAAAGRTLRRPEYADELAATHPLTGLLAGVPLLRTPALDGHDELTLVDGPLRDPGAAEDDAAALTTLRSRRRPTESAGALAPKQIRDLTDPSGIRRALDRLDSPGDPELEGLLADLLHHPETRVRLHAHRTGRRLLDRTTYLRHTTILLDDPEPDVVRSAINTLGHARYEPSIPALVGLLAHSRTAVRRAAADGLSRFGPEAVPALRYAADHARPDKRHVYATVLDRIADDDRG